MVLLLVLDGITQIQTSVYLAVIAQDRTNVLAAFNIMDRNASFQFVLGLIRQIQEYVLRMALVLPQTHVVVKQIGLERHARYPHHCVSENQPMTHKYALEGVPVLGMGRARIAPVAMVGLNVNFQFAMDSPLIMDLPAAREDHVSLRTLAHVCLPLGLEASVNYLDVMERPAMIQVFVVEGEIVCFLMFVPHVPQAMEDLNVSCHYVMAFFPIHRLFVQVGGLV